MAPEAALFQYLLRLGDNALILGHRVSEWCGHGPVIEEDIAMANVALDLIGQTQLWLGLAGEVEGKGRSADALAFRRDVMDFRNLLLCERPNGDFGHTILRQYFFDAFNAPLLAALGASADPRIAGIAQKLVKEARYHLERSREVVVALGDGTEESRARMQAALDALWAYTGEMLAEDAVDAAVREAGTGADLEAIRGIWTAEVTATLAEATLTPPAGDFAHRGGKDGRMHSEHLGHLLVTMQWLQRSYPEAVW